MIGVTEESALYIPGEDRDGYVRLADDAHSPPGQALCPAKHASAGKKKSTRTGKRRTLPETAPGAVCLAAAKSTKKDPYFHCQIETLKSAGPQEGHHRHSAENARGHLPHDPG